MGRAEFGGALVSALPLSLISPLPLRMLKTPRSTIFGRDVLFKELKEAS